MFVDTTFCIDLMREQHRAVPGPAQAFLARLGDTGLAAAVFVLCELQAGARLSQHPDRELRKVERLMARLEVVYPDHAFAVAYGESEAVLRQNGTPVPTMDLLIGVTAKIAGRSLVTRDPDHFRKIPGLVVESY